ncbi:telomere regulation protein Stn1-domain-containing protein [Lipomyces chichibuensis]|uniref:telomere regulation protein Stn1-domain-containing protein n=1 Tax=Lipomyces chichibuensis TaxID=1546026 RepID=UPI0033432EB0
MRRSKHKNRNAIERRGNDPTHQQQAASLNVMRKSSLAPDKSSVTFTSNPSSSTRHHHTGKKSKKKPKIKHADQMREQKMLEIQASKYAYVGIMKQLESAEDRAEVVRDRSISAVNSTRNNEHSGDEYSDDSYYSESTPRAQIRADRASRQLATLELFPRGYYDKDLQLGLHVGASGTNANRDHSGHFGAATVEIPFEIDMPSRIIPRSRRAIAVSDRNNAYHNDAIKNGGLLQPEKQVGLTEVELPLSSWPIPAELISRKHSPVPDNTVRLDFSDQFNRLPKSTSALHGLPWSQQGQIQLFKGFQSKQLGRGEVEIEIPISECDAGSEVDVSVSTPTKDICPTTLPLTAFESSNRQLHKAEVELPEVMKIDDITANKKESKTAEKYSVMINENIKMIRIASSPIRQERSFQVRADCKAAPARVATEVGHGQGFVTLDDLPEFGCDPSALARPATSPAQTSSGKSIVPSTPSPRRKTIKRPKSKPGLDIIVAVVNGMPFYKRNTYFKSPIYDTWACLSIADVQALKQIPATQMYGDHFWKNHPIKYICILGICVGVTIRETNAIVKVDDGSGGEIECITKEQTRFGFVESIDPGSLVRVLGTLGYYRKAKQLEINTIVIIRDLYAEVEFWEKMLATRDIIDEKWILRDSDFNADDRKRLRRNLDAI